MKLRRKAVSKRAVRFGLLAINLAILVSIVSFVVLTPRSSGASPALVGNTQTTQSVANPLDQLSSADIALTIARLNNLPEATAITNQADSQASELTTSPANSSVVSKPQVVATALKSKADIQSYTVASGDTVTSIAAKFGVTSDSIRWSNNLTGDSVTAGSKLTVPPVNGIVYTVKDGDNADGLATKYKANKDQIVAFNDAEIRGLKPGEQIIIPNGTIAPVVTARTITASASSSAMTYPWGGSSAIYGGEPGSQAHASAVRGGPQASSVFDRPSLSGGRATSQVPRRSTHRWRCCRTASVGRGTTSLGRACFGLPASASTAVRRVRAGQRPSPTGAPSVRDC